MVTKVAKKEREAIELTESLSSGERERERERSRENSVSE